MGIECAVDTVAAKDGVEDGGPERNGAERFNGIAQPWSAAREGVNEERETGDDGDDGEFDGAVRARCQLLLERHVLANDAGRFEDGTFRQCIAGFRH